MSLYTKYRPRDWDSVIGQDAISNVLRTSLSKNRVGHAYILTGSRGTWKTTTARIMAKWVNCLDLQNGNPCHKCAHCIAFDEWNMLDCIEIDGASNNGVENVRDLIEKARFEPNQWKYKIYIIDEVHMLSTGAFNALLKTLEEPPSHVIFILATTEIEKVPETIRSRSLRFDFKKISETDIIKRLEYVCKEENIKAEHEALEIIARAARWALRDALTLTEQNNINGEISTEYVRSTLSLIEDSLIAKIINIIISSDKDAMIEMIESLRTRHAEVRGLFDQILYVLRDKMVEVFSGKSKDGITFEEYSTIFGIFEGAYSKIRSIPDGSLLIEITLMRAVARKEISTTTPKTTTPIQSAKKETIWVAPASVWEFWGSMNKSVVWWKVMNSEGSGWETVLVGWNTENWWAERTSFSSPDSFGTFSTKSTESTITKTSTSEDNLSEEKKTENTTSPFSYIRLLEEIKKIKSTLVLDLKTARFEIKDNNLTFIFSKEWHYNRTNDPSIKTLIAETLTGLYGGNWNVICRIDSAVNANLLDEVF